MNIMNRVLARFRATVEDRQELKYEARINELEHALELALSHLEHRNADPRTAELCVMYIKGILKRAGRYYGKIAR